MRNIDIDAERNFENRKARGEGVRQAQSKFYWATEIEFDRHMRKSCEWIANKDVLEVGCASGYDAVTYTGFARSYTGLDISDQAIRNCEALGLENAKFFCVDGHHIPAEDASFDCVVVNSLLHHLDLKQSLQEISRVLKKDGILIFREPLGTNPLFQLYRYLTPGARTADERPFTFGDLSLMREFFILKDVQWFGFLRIVSAFFMNPGIRSSLSSIDRWISKTPMRCLYWQFAGVAYKKDAPVTRS